MVYKLWGTDLVKLKLTKSLKSVIWKFFWIYSWKIQGTINRFLWGNSILGAQMARCSELYHLLKVCYCFDLLITLWQQMEHYKFLILAIDNVRKERWTPKTSNMVPPFHCYNRSTSTEIFWTRFMVDNKMEINKCCLLNKSTFSAVVCV